MRLWLLIAGIKGLFFSEDPAFDPSRQEGVCVTCDGVTYTYPETLHPLGDETRFSGEDILGRYSGTMTRWDKCSFVTMAKSYVVDDPMHDVSVMAQFFTDDVYNTQLPNATDDARMNGVLSCYPVFSGIYPDPSSGFLQFKGIMAGKNAIIDNTWNAHRRLQGGVDAGPLVFFSAVPKAEIVAPLTNAMTSNYVFTNYYTLQFGIMGSVTTIPEGFTMDFLLVRSRVGVQDSIATWGSYARLYHGKPASTGDYTTDHLGYSTDNGAHYYFNTDHFANYEGVLDSLKQYFDDQAIPVRHLLLDSWWYYEDKKTQGVTNWTSRPEIFPHGLSYIRTLMKMPFIAHNRHWSDKTVYAKQNGGKYRFAMDNGTHHGVPLDYAFWENLLREARDWGMTVYEQDWLNLEFTSVSALYQSATLARTWLLQMGEAAANLGLNIQYCMAYPRHIISSLELPAVTQARVTDDYQPQHPDWRELGITSAFAHAVGLRPNKDSFYSSRATNSTMYQPSVEIYNRMHACISTLSQSTVAVSDTIGDIDRDLVMKSCRADGALLHPDAPAMLIDAAFYSRAKLLMPSGTGLRGEVWTTQSCYGSRCYKYIFAVPDAEYHMTLQDMGLSPHGTYFAFEHNTTDTLIRVNASKALMLPPATALTFHLFTVMPSVSDNKFVFLGEVSKWVSLSRMRFHNFENTEHRFSVVVKGMEDENVTVAWARVDTLNVVYEHIRLPPSGTAHFFVYMPSRPEEGEGNVGHDNIQPVVIVKLL
eukprot:GEMP01005666.1.p1 GENE.GEMP01005666.1~~GEMP01005666.1.p1  ORF type:complete len:783 (-),score=179.11 GEMP01005666.1:1622-3895(-)